MELIKLCLLDFVCLRTIYLQFHAPGFFVYRLFLPGMPFLDGGL